MVFKKERFKLRKGMLNGYYIVDTFHDINKGHYMNKSVAKDEADRLNNQEEQP